MRELTEAEARDLYVILADLEALAVRLGGPPPSGKIETLAALNERIGASTGNPSEIIEENFEWHRALVDDCPNATLLDMLEMLRTQVYRYEYAYFQPQSAAGKSAAFHRDIIAALDPFDLDGLTRAIERHWLSDLSMVLPRIRSSE